MTEFIRWAVVTALLVMVLTLLIKNRRQQERILAQSMTIRACHDVIKQGNEDVSRLQAQRDRLREQLGSVRKFSYMMDAAPTGKTLQLLNSGGATILGDITAKRAKEMGIIGWALTADRDKDEEVRRGYIPAPKAG